MVLLRREELIHRPPPRYPKESSSLTVCIKYGGTFQNAPVSAYLGGVTNKLDYCEALDFNRLNLDTWCNNFAGLGKKRTYYVSTSNVGIYSNYRDYKEWGFKLLLKDVGTSSAPKRPKKKKAKTNKEVDPPVVHPPVPRVETEEVHLDDLEPLTAATVTQEEERMVEGPSMWEQLEKVRNPAGHNRTQVVKTARRFGSSVQFRVPPSLHDSQVSTSTSRSKITDLTIIEDGGMKFVDLNSGITQESQCGLVKKKKKKGKASRK